MRLIFKIVLTLFASLGAMFWFLVLTGANVFSAPVDFDRDIKTLLQTHCIACHGEFRQRAQLRLDRRIEALKGSENGPVLVVAKPESSLLWQRISAKDAEQRMPPDGPGLEDDQIELIRRWIEEGATWTDDGSKDLFELAKEHWSFQPLSQDFHWAGSESIDRWVKQSHAEQSVTFSPPADRWTLLRRVTLDLTGLPPTLDDQQQYEKDDPAIAYEKAVDRLLASPAYGERWGRFWLDLVGWAESDGFEHNAIRPQAWRYRDYVIEAFNQDKPYDRFIIEQMAGDELEPLTDEHLIATGFLAGVRYNFNEEDRAVQINEPIVDIANLTATVGLGLTFACAQCHDHKFEPITIHDYYAWHGYFIQGQPNNLGLTESSLLEGWPAAFERQKDEAFRLRDALKEIGRLQIRESSPGGSEGDTEIEDALTTQDRKRFMEASIRSSIFEKYPEMNLASVWGFFSPVSSPHAIVVRGRQGQYDVGYDPQRLKEAEPRILRRGDVHLASDETISASLPRVLIRPGMRQPISRRELAEWLVSDENPLAARVWINFVWQQHFGRGLVETPGDFGLQGIPPTHPELLDGLAYDWIRHGRSTKYLHRPIVLSQVYTQSSFANPESMARDPDNRWLTRWKPRRLEAEAIRDGSLAVAGQLDETRFGPSMLAHIPSQRRTLYLMQRRYLSDSAQALFDSPITDGPCLARKISTVPLQSLYLLNDAENFARAEAMARRIRTLAGSDHGDQIELAFRIALTRLPRDTERVQGLRFLRGDESQSQLTRFCQVLLNLNEFVSIP